MNVMRCSDCGEIFSGTVCEFCNSSDVEQDQMDVEELSLPGNIQQYQSASIDEAATIPVLTTASSSVELSEASSEDDYGWRTIASANEASDDHLLLDDWLPEPDEYNEDEHVRSRPLTWYKEVSQPHKALPPLTPPPRTITRAIQRSQRRFTPSVLFWISLATLIVLVFSGIFGVFISSGRGLTANASKAMSLQISPDQTSPGGMLTLRGSHFTPRGRVGLSRDNAIPVIDTGGESIAQADTSGRFSDTVVIDNDWGSGQHIVHAEDALTHKITSYPVLITGQSTSLRPAHLSVSVEKLDLGSGDQSTNATQMLKLINAGGGQISWRATSNQPWLLISPSSGTFSANQDVPVTVAVDRSSLQPGSYSAQVVFTSNAGTEDVTIRLTVTPLVAGSEPILQLTPALLSFTGRDNGSAPAAQQLTISNPGGSALSWRATVNVSWLTVTPATGTIPAHSNQTVTIGSTISTLLPDTYQAMLTFTGQGDARNSPQNVYVSMTITPQCTLEVMPGLLSFTSAYLQGAPAAKAVNLSMASGCSVPMKWSASSNARWLAINTTKGSIPSSPAVVIRPAGLNPGVYHGALTFTAGQSMQTLGVTLTVGVEVTPLVTTTPASLTFNSAMGASNPGDQHITLTNTGGSALLWSALASTLTGGPWLTVNPGQGSLAAHQSVSLDVHASLLSGLAQGSNNGSITISGTNSNGQTAAGSPQMIPVNFNVNAACSVSLPDTPLRFEEVSGQSAPSPQSITLLANGTCAHGVTWSSSIQSNSGNWVQLSQASGSFSNAQAGSTDVQILENNLKAGDYSATITLTARDSQTQAVIGNLPPIRVTLHVQPACVLQSPSVSSISSTQTFTVGASATCSSSVTITSTAVMDTGNGWLTVSPGSVTVASGKQATFTATIETSGLPAGPYSGRISISGISNGYSTGNPQIIPVNFTVAAPPAPSVTPTDIILDTTSAGSSQTVTISNTGGSAMSWSAALAGDAPVALSVSKLSGTVQAGDSDTLNLVLDASSAVDSTTSLTITMMDANQNVVGNPIIIHVTMKVVQPEVVTPTPTPTPITEQVSGD